MEESKEVRQIPIEDIIPNRFQPRINFEEKALNDLCNSIKQHGIIQPLVVRPLGEKFEIIAGERRYKAATMAGLTTVPAIVTDMDDNTSAEVALVENVQRKDLTPIEEARSYRNMLDRSGMTQDELAKKMGLSQSTIANKLRLLNLCDEVQNALMEDKISERHARALLSVAKKEDQVRWLNRIINERLTVRQLDLAIKDELAEKASQIKEEEQIENDIPIVDINPDIESIISNTTDINAVDDSPRMDVFKGINIPTNIDGKSQEDNSDSSENDEKNVIEKPASNNVPNKFFNFLEDEEVNMSFDENKPEEVADNINKDVFSFTPEFSQPSGEDAEVLLPDQNEEKFAEFDAITGNNNDVKSVNDSVIDFDSIEMLDESALGINQGEINNDEQIETLDVDEPVQVSVIDGNEQVDTLSVENNADKEEMGSIDAQDEVVHNIQEDESEPTEEVKESELQSSVSIEQKDDDVKVEPIPIVEDGSVIDPVKLFETLEPDFYDKLKENIGLDLKTAINDYRDLTQNLVNRGFNINIDEVDAPGTYKITIDITKE